MDDKVKFAMKRSKRIKDKKKYDKADHSLQGTERMFITREDEAELLEEVIADLLVGNKVSLSKEQKKMLLPVFEHIQKEEIDDGLLSS